jgi:hypothetical protein
MSPRANSMLPRSAVKFGTPSSAMLILPDDPLILILRVHAFEESARKGHIGNDDISVILIAVFQGDTDSTAVLDHDLVHAGAGDGVTAQIGEAGVHGVGDRAHAPARESPGAHAAVDVAHGVVQQDVSRAGRHHAQSGADDAAA